MAYQTPTDFEGECLMCCRKCKGLFPMEQDVVKHIQSCCGSPYKSPCVLFACERKLFLQLIALEILPQKNVSLHFNGVEEDMQINTSTQPDPTEQPLFLPGSQQIVSQSPNGDQDFLQGTNAIGSQCESQPHSQFLSDTRTIPTQPQAALFMNKEELASSNITNSDSIVPDTFFPSTRKIEPMASVSVMESQPSLIQQPITEEHPTTLIKPRYLNDGNEEKVKNAIARNLKYLQDTNLTRIPSPIEKQLGLFCDSRLTFPRLQSPLEKQFQTRVQSPVDKAINFLGEPGACPQPLPGSANPSLPFSCNLGGMDLLGSYTTQDDNQAGLPSIEEFPTLQYLDLAKKDPFWGQNIGLSQINTKDPFLINASEPPDKVTCQKISAVEKSTEDISIHSSPTLQLQDGNYFNFASTLDEPTQLDYLDLATLDFLTNPNLGTYTGLGPWRPDRYPSDKEDNIYPGDLMSTESNLLAGETMSSYTLSHSMSSEDLFTHSQHARPGEISKSKNLFKPITQSGTRTKAITKRTKTQNVKKKVSKGIEKIRKQSEIEQSGEPFFKVQKVEDKDKVKNMPKANTIQTGLNVKEHLEGFTETEKESFKAVLGPNRSIVVKKIKLEHPPHAEPEVIEENSDFKVEKIADRVVYNCKRCSYTSSKRDNMEKHQQDHVVNMTLQCPECSYSCAQISALKSHFEGRHSKLKHLVCEVCGEVLKDRQKLQNHMTIHTGQHKFECPDCDYKTNVKLSYTDHIKKHAGFYLTCDIEGCEFKTIYYRVLVQHKKKHEGLKQLVCEHCSYTTAEAGSLKRHVQLQHLKEQNYKCLKCNYYSVNRHDVVMHVKNKHLQMKSYQCNQCSFKAAYANGLKLHLMQHAGIRPYKCSRCNYRTKKAGDIKRHIETMHRGDPEVSIENIDLPYSIDSKKFKCKDLGLNDMEMDKYIIELSGDNKKQNKNDSLSKNRPVDKKSPETKGKKGTKLKTVEMNSDLLSVNKTSLLKSIIDVSQMTGKGKAVSLLKSNNISSTKDKGSLHKSKSSNDIPSSVSGLIKTITIPGVGDSTDNEITTFQCSFCLSMFTALYEIMEHIVKCKDSHNSGSLIID